MQREFLDANREDHPFGYRWGVGAVEIVQRPEDPQAGTCPHRGQPVCDRAHGKRVDEVGVPDHRAGSARLQFAFNRELRIPTQAGH